VVTASLAVARLPRVPMMVTGWMMLGATFMVLPWLHGSLPALALASAAGGFVMPLALAALNAVIAEQTSGPERRTAFATQQVAANGGVSLGMLSGGAVIAVLGTQATMHVAGAVLIAAPLLLVTRARFTKASSRRRHPSGLGDLAVRRATDDVGRAPASELGRLCDGAAFKGPGDSPRGSDRLR
jgi:predicted MFS family arabinose efflux permease